MNKQASWAAELEIMYGALASKGYIWMDHDEEKKVEAALAKDPDNFYLICAKGILNFNYNWDVAIDCFSKALVQRPFDSNQYYNRGRKYLSQDRFLQAFSDLEMAVQLDKEDNWKWHYVGVVHYLLGKFEESTHYFIKAWEVAKRHNKDLESCEADWLWTAYAHMGDMKKATEIINTITLDTPIVPVVGDDDAYKNVCLLLNGLMSLEDFLKTISADNEGGSVNELYGVAKYFYYIKKDVKSAMEYIDKTLALEAKKGAWGFKMARMDKEAWQAQL